MCSSFDRPNFYPFRFDGSAHTEFMICRHCGSDIALSNFLVNTLSPAAKHWTHGRLYSTADVLVQDLVNPLGGRFRVVAVRKAQCAKTDNVSTPICILRLLEGYSK